jgi:hypothetical protein
VRDAGSTNEGFGLLSDVLSVGWNEQQSMSGLKGGTTRDSSLFVRCLFDESSGSFRPRNNTTLERLGVTSNPTLVRWNIILWKTYLNEPDVYSAEGCIGNPLPSVAAEMLYTDSTDAMAIQMLSYANHRPGHILANSIELERQVYAPQVEHPPSPETECCLG